MVRRTNGITSAMKSLATFGLLASLGLVLLPMPAAAWVVGPACPGGAGKRPVIERFQGNFLGGRPFAGIGRPVDFRSFQNCFRTVEECRYWLAHLSARYPLRPAYAYCTAQRTG